MNNSISKIGATLDTKRELLLTLKSDHPEFFKILWGYLKDKHTFSDFEHALVNALSIVGITIFIKDEDLSLHIHHTTSSGKILHESFDGYEDALHFAIALLHTKSI